MKIVNECCCGCESDDTIKNRKTCPICNNKGEAVVKHGAKTVKEVNVVTGAMKNSNCKENNPLGVCCHKIIQEAIDKGLK